MEVFDGLRDVVTCAECGGTSLDVGLDVCPADGSVLGEVRMTPVEFNRGHPFGSHG